MAARFSGSGQPYEGLVRASIGGPRWTGAVRFIPEKLGEPLRWRKPARIFVNSMSDLFHEDVTNEQIAAVFGVMAACPQHTFQVLTKRPARMRQWFEWLGSQRESCAASPRDVLLVEAAGWMVRHHEGIPFRINLHGPWPLPNAHLLVSVEDQRSADERIPYLLACPAVVRGVSLEPMLGPVDLTSLDVLGPMREPARPYDPVVRLDALRGHVRGPDDVLDARLDWVIVGGESGPGARPYDLAWPRSVIAQCREAGVPVFHKQVGARPVGDLLNSIGEPIHGALGLRHRKGADMAEWPENLRVREFPDGRTHDGMPGART